MRQRNKQTVLLRLFTMEKVDKEIVEKILPVEYYLSDWHVRVTWIAFMTLWVFWGLAWFIRFAFGGDTHSVPALNIQSSQVAADNAAVHHTNAVDPGAIDPETGAPVGTTTAAGTTTTNVHHNKKFAPMTAPAWSVNIFNRLNRAHDMLRDLVLILLSVLTLNTFARASTRAVMIIAWIFVAFAAVYFAIEASYEHRYIRLLFSLIFYGLGLTVVGLAYAQGFY